MSQPAFSVNILPSNVSACNQWATVSSCTSPPRDKFLNSSSWQLSGAGLWVTKCFEFIIKQKERFLFCHILIRFCYLEHDCVSVHVYQKVWCRHRLSYLLRMRPTGISVHNMRKLELKGKNSIRNGMFRADHNRLPDASPDRTTWVKF